MYELGVGVSFILMCFTLVMVVVRANSLAAKNLRKIGMRYSWAGGEPKEISGLEYSRHPLAVFLKFLVLIVISAPWIIFSWLYVAYFIATFLYGLSKDMGAPAEVKEFRWRLKNQNMTLDELIVGLHAMKRDGRPIEDFRAEIYGYVAENHPSRVPHQF